MIQFSSDLELPFNKLIDYFSLRFQVELNFRYDKLYYSLNNFMNISSITMISTTNLPLVMVDVSHVLLC